VPPTYLGHSCVLLQGVSLQKMRISRYYKIFEPVHMCKILSFKIYGLQYVLKYTTKNVCVEFRYIKNVLCSLYVICHPEKKEICVCVCVCVGRY
jgi:hypothetical protein